MSIDKYAHVLPMAVEAAQKIASDMVAKAIEEAADEAFRRGRAEGLGQGLAHDAATMRKLFERADDLLSEIESSGRAIDHEASEVAPVMKRDAKKIPAVKVPDHRDATLDEIVSFLRSHGGETVVDVETLTIDTDGVDDALRTLQSEVDLLREVLQEMRNRLDVRSADADDADADDADVG